VASGGRSGYGNFFLKRCGRLSDRLRLGGVPDLKYLHLELKLLADVGLLGFPNVGKSLFINGISNVLSKVGNYSFTTLAPVLGLLKNHFCRNIIIADIPGIIRFSSEGHGLGFKFLKHLSKTQLLLHFLDISLIDSKMNLIRIL